MQTVYFDHNSTTALKPAVLEAMLPWMNSQHGNPTSRHVFGRNARDAVEYARAQVANAVGVQASQVVFTASGTEANNFAITGITANLEPAQILASNIEHPCVSRPARALQAHGWQTNVMPVDKQGKLQLDFIAAQLNTSTGLVSAMLANNETGVLQDISALSALVKHKKQAGHVTYVHTDAVQAFGKIPVDFNELGVNAMTVSSHKIGGPLGAGALVLDKRVDIQPLLHGGGQERGLRSGTENIAAIVGFGVASELTVQNLSRYAAHTKMLRDHLEQGLTHMQAHIFGNQAARLPNTSFFAFANAPFANTQVAHSEVIEGETLVTALDKVGFAVASGSACSSDSTEPSHVLLAMGVPPDIARGAIRVSFGAENSLAQVDAFLKALAQQVKHLKQLTAIEA